MGCCCTPTPCPVRINKTDIECVGFKPLNNVGNTIGLTTIRIIALDLIILDIPLHAQGSVFWVDVLEPLFFNNQTSEKTWSDAVVFATRCAGWIGDAAVTQAGAAGGIPMPPAPGIPPAPPFVH